LADTDNPNLTDGGQHSLFQAHMREVYRDFFAGSTCASCAPAPRAPAASR
jgi:hypothetical protein